MKPLILAIVGATIYPGPDAAPIRNGTLVIRDGRISAAGRLKAPRGAELIDGHGLTVVAGFWNSHVHFTEPKWTNAAEVERNLTEMFTRYGFTAVMDTASDPAVTFAIRRRNPRGPMILSCGAPIVPKGGSPYYVKPVVLPEVESPEQAVAMVRERTAAGSDAIKIFTASWATPQRPVPMPLEIVRAITTEVHRSGKLVYSHPSDTTGLERAVEGGVDILAHVVEVPGDIDPPAMARMKSQRMSLVPTLTLFRENRNIARLLNQVDRYSMIGGEILFGTDVGYLTEYDPAPEYELLSKAGLTPRQILAALTTAPAARFGYATRKGRIERGMDADLAVLDGDPMENPRAFAQVRFTLREGVVTYRHPPSRTDTRPRSGRR